MTYQGLRKNQVFFPEALERYFEERKIMCMPVDDKDFKERAAYQFRLPVTSYINQEVLKGYFLFELRVFFVRNKGLIKSWEIIINSDSEMPFHPNFKLGYSFGFFGDPYGQWLADPSVKSIDVDLDNMIHALQYDRDFVSIEHGRVGNDRAKNWFLEESHKNKNKFPTDDFFGALSKGKVKNSQEEHKGKFLVNEVPKVKKTFKIQKVQKYTLKEEDRSSFETDEEECSASQALSEAVLYIKPAAKKQIFDHIQWGHLKATNKSEQGGILLGKVFRDKKSENVVGVVEEVVEADSARGSATYLEIDHETWHQMIKRADALLEHEHLSDLQIIGWYHTHPNSLDVFMSGTDKNTQRLHFNQNWHFAIVLNPHREIWKAFNGADAVECLGCFVKSSEDINSLECKEPIDDNTDKREEMYTSTNYPTFWGTLLNIPGVFMKSIYHVFWGQHNSSRKEREEEKSNKEYGDGSL